MAGRRSVRVPGTPSRRTIDSVSARALDPVDIFRECSCGAGALLGDERDLLDKRLESIRKRFEELTEEEQALADKMNEGNSAAFGFTMRQRKCVDDRCTVDNQMKKIEAIMQQQVIREDTLRKSYQSVETTFQDEVAINGDMKEKESAFLREQRVLLDEFDEVAAREHAAQEELQAIEWRQESIDSQVEMLERKREEMLQLIETLGEDNKLLDEMEAEIDPVALSLDERERKLEEEEDDVSAEEAELSERYRRMIEACHQEMGTLKAQQEEKEQLERRSEELNQTVARLCSRQHVIGK